MNQNTFCSKCHRIPNQCCCSLVRELTDEEYEKIMLQWDYWRKQIANGDTSSSPRDWFEGAIDDLFNRVEK